MTNRDIALLFWVAVAAVVVLWRPGARSTVGGLLTLALRSFGVLIALYWLYLAAVVAVAASLGIWNAGLGKETIAWAAVPGLALLFGFVKAAKERGYYVRALVRVIGLTALIEFYVNLASFPLPIELILVALAVALPVVSVVAELRPDTKIVKRWADAVLGVIGIAVLVGTVAYLVGAWDHLDHAELALSFGLPIWLTLASLPFVFVFSLYATYQGHFVWINVSQDDRWARRRAKLALVRTYGLRNHDLAGFSGLTMTELPWAKTWREARRIATYGRMQARLKEAEEDLTAARLDRYEGVAGTDWEGRPFDEREFEETKTALDFIAGVHRARYVDGRFRRDLMETVVGIVSRKIPDSEWSMTVAKNGRSWFVWRRTIGGWYLGIGMVGEPTNEWTYLANEPPTAFPAMNTGWHLGEFPTTVAEPD